MEPSLIGFWEVCAFQANEGVVLQVISGSEGDLVQFTENNRFIIWKEGGVPYRNKYRFPDDAPSNAIDIYAVNPRTVNHAIFVLDRDQLTICSASAGYDRPAEFSTSNKYHAVITYKRSDAANVEGCM